MNLDSKLQRSTLRFPSSFASSVSSVYLSFVDLVRAARICEVASCAVRGLASS
jgi:hypothetical protein